MEDVFEDRSSRMVHRLEQASLDRLEIQPAIRAASLEQAFDYLADFLADGFDNCFRSLFFSTSRSFSLVGWTKGV